MLNLIRLELRKNKFKGSLLGIAIANVSIMLLLTLIIITDEITEEIFNGYPDMLLIVDTMVRATFTVYASVLLAKFIIDEYKNKTITVMFTYPIQRKKLIAAKVMIVAVWMFAAILLSNVIITAYMLGLNQYLSFITEPLSVTQLSEHGVRLLFHAVAAAGISLVPLYFGMLKKSIPATIVSSILVVSVMYSNNNNFSLSSIIAIPLTLAAIGIVITIYSFRNIEKTDVL